VCETDDFDLVETVPVKTVLGTPARKRQLKTATDVVDIVRFVCPNRLFERTSGTPCARSQRPIVVPRREIVQTKRYETTSCSKSSPPRALRLHYPYPSSLGLGPHTYNERVSLLVRGPGSRHH